MEFILFVGVSNIHKKINLKFILIVVEFSEILGPVFGGFLTEHFGFKKAATSMSMCALVAVIICSIRGIRIFKSYQFCFQAIICSVTCIYFDEFKPYKRKNKSNEKSVNRMKQLNKETRQMKRNRPMNTETTPLLV